MSAALTLSLLEEVADFLSSQPSREELLAFRPSSRAQARIEELLAAGGERSLSNEESAELQQFEQTELLMRLIKARLRG